MEDLVPPLLTAVREVRWLVASGHSVRRAFDLSLKDNHGNLSRRFREWWALYLQGRAPHFSGSHFEKIFLELLDRGCSGQPVLEALTALEEEIEAASYNELELHLSTLPFKMLIPLLLLQFPAYLLILLGPMLRELEQQLMR